MTREPEQSDPAQAAAPGMLSPAEREAIQWLVRLTSGHAAAADHAAFRAWRAQSPEHEAALAAARRLWLGMGPLLSTSPTTARARMHWTWLALAASLLIVIVLGYGLFDLERGRNPWMSAEIDSDPGIAVAFADAAGRCRLKLGGGDAYFDVAPNPDEAATGATVATRVNMPGSAFSVQPDVSGVLVTVTSGRLEVDTNASEGTSDGKAARVLGVGQRLRCLAYAHASVRPPAFAATSARFRCAVRYDYVSTGCQGLGDDVAVGDVEIRRRHRSRVGGGGLFG